MLRHNFERLVALVPMMKKIAFYVLALIVPLLPFQDIHEGACQSDYPNKPITIYVAFEPGGQTDIATRKLAPEVSKNLGQPVVVENKPGAGGIVATAFIAKQAPDGYRLAAISTSPLVRSPHMQKVPYDPLKDVTPLIQLISNVTGFFVRSDSPLKTFSDFAKLAKSSKDPVKYAHIGVGTGANLAMEFLKINYGFNLEGVPFEGDSPTNTAIQGGHLPIGSGSIGGFGSLVKQGQFRILVFFGSARIGIFPEVPIAKELGYDLVLETKQILVGPPNLPSSVVEKLEDTFTKALKSPNYKSLMNDMCVTCEPYRGSQTLRMLLLEEYKMYGEFIQKLGLGKK